MKKNHYQIDEELDIPEILSDRIKSRIDHIDYQPRKNHGRTVMLSCVSILLFLSVCVGAMMVSPDFKAYAMEIPLVEHLMGWFSDDDNFEYAKEHGYPVDNIQENNEEGYSLYIKDIYMDQARVSMKIGMIGPDQQMINLNDYHVQVRLGPSNITLQRGVTTEDPWFYFDVDDYMIQYTEKDVVNIDYQVTIKKQDFAYTSQIYSYDISFSEPIYYAINHQEKMEGADLDIYALTAYPSYLEMQYTVTAHEGYAKPDIRGWEIVDNSSSYYTHYDGATFNGITKSLIEPSFYYDDDRPEVLTATFEYLIYPYQQYVTVKKEDNFLNSFTVGSHSFTIEEVFDAGVRKDDLGLVLTCNDTIKASEFPKMDIRRGESDNWEQGIVRDDFRGKVLTKTEAEKVLGSSLKDILELQELELDDAVTGFKSYYQERYDDDADNMEILSVLKGLNQYDEYYFLENHELVSEQTYIFNRMPKRDIYTIAIYGEKEIEEIIIPISLN
ncbi:DUF4179 domain-containing protein [Vallitalea okinawensis]|uniref:DUF4179 domain-containing protein n=1 Tax=Vallitalea okinawensis TaxID=2078660 RepID=UPI000CFCB34F|nr:DUF4179 domain-containing protein [Vallitalea okinawensis]